MEIKLFEQFIFEKETKPSFRGEDGTTEGLENAKKFFEFFDKIYVINLKEREDRWNLVKEQFKLLGIPMSSITRIDAYNGRDNYDKIKKDPMSLIGKYKDYCEAEEVGSKESRGYQTFTKVNPGVYACCESHRKTVLKAKNDGVKRPLIMEDDMTPTLALLKDGAAAAEALANRKYDLVNFGLLSTKFGTNFKGRGYYWTLDNGDPTRFHAYTVHPDFYDDYIKYSLDNWSANVDVQMAKKMRENGHKYLGLNPRFFVQLGNYSDLNGKIIHKGGKDEMLFKFPE